MSILAPPARGIDPRRQRFGAGVSGVLLATTGVCLGCRLHVLRWWVPSLFAQLVRRTDRLVGLPGRQPISCTNGRVGDER